MTTLAELEAALASNTLDAWLARLANDAIRARVQHALQLDAAIRTEHPASLASCLLARLIGEPELASSCAAWRRELDERGEPWIRPLRGLASVPRSLAVLDDIDLGELEWPRFESDEVIVVESASERLVWPWTKGSDLRMESQPDGRANRYPRLEQNGEGAVFLRRGPRRIELPSPEGSHVQAHFSRDGTRLFVYGDVEDGFGFVRVFDPETLTILRELWTDQPIRRVYECDHSDPLLLGFCGGDLAITSSQGLRLLQLHAHAACLSPSGRHLATLDSGVRVFELRGDEGVPEQAGFPTQFDPSGARLLSHTSLFDGHTGAEVARLSGKFGRYLEGGPASPWLHVGERWLTDASSGRVWGSRTGEPQLVEGDLHYSLYWLRAYDRAGETMAVLSIRSPRLIVHELPSGRVIGEFELQGCALAMRSDGRQLAVRHGHEVEIWTTGGERLRGFQHEPGVEDQLCPPGTLRFSRDGRRIASYAGSKYGWRIWALEGDDELRLETREAIEQVPGFEAPQPRDWTVEAGRGRSAFVHAPTGTRIVLPATGPWVFNPARPEIGACRDLHVELCGG